MNTDVPSTLGQIGEESIGVEEELNIDKLILPLGVTDCVPLTSMLDLFNWYKQNLCRPEIYDCRNYRVLFGEEEFVHLIKLVDKYGNEPKNRRMAIANIKSGQLRFFFGGKKSPPNFSVQRAKQLILMRSIIEKPWIIVRNWQILGKGNPGDAYIRNFGTGERAQYRVLICGYAGNKRIPITMFPRQGFSRREISTRLWP